MKPSRKGACQADLTLDAILKGKPKPQDVTGVKMWLEACWTFYQRGSHEAFRLAWNCGEILSHARESCEYGKWGKWLEDHCPYLSYETATRWANFWERIKPTDYPDFDTLTIEKAKLLIRNRPTGEADKPASLPTLIRKAFKACDVLAKESQAVQGDPESMEDLDGWISQINAAIANLTKAKENVNALVSGRKKTAA